jgi:Rieske Fe-S protein
MDKNRREFIKKSCGLCASIVGISILASALDSCTPLKYVSAEVSQGKILIPTSNFIEDSKLVIVKHQSLEYDIALVKGNNNTYRAFELKCTHQDNALTATASGFQCNLHGSTFTLEGKVNTAPATSPLKEYKTILNGESVEITL